MAIILDKDNDVVTYENQPEQAHAMFPNASYGVDVNEVIDLIAGIAGLSANDGIRLNNDADLNTVTNAGNYYALTSNNIMNVPTPTYNLLGFRLFVFTFATGNILQLSIMTDGASDNIIYIRATKNGVSWSRWTYVLTQAILAARFKLIGYTEGLLDFSSGSATIPIGGGTTNALITLHPTNTLNDFGVYIATLYNNVGAVKGLAPLSGVTVTVSDANLIINKDDSIVDSVYYKRWSNRT